MNICVIHLCTLISIIDFFYSGKFTFLRPSKAIESRCIAQWFSSLILMSLGMHVRNSHIAVSNLSIKGHPMGKAGGGCVLRGAEISSGMKERQVACECPWAVVTLECPQRGEVVITIHRPADVSTTTISAFLLLQHQMLTDLAVIFPLLTLDCEGYSRLVIFKVILLQTGNLFYAESMFLELLGEAPDDYL